MTDIDNMEAGPEFAALIAEEVMEWPRWYGDEEAPRGFVNGCVIYDSGDFGRELTYPVRGERMDKWDPTTDIAAAWEVLEQLDAWDWQLTSHGEGVTMTIFKDGTHYEATAQEVPLAICRAARKAVRARKGGDVHTT